MGYGIIKYDKKNKKYRSIRYNNLSLHMKVQRKRFKKCYIPNKYMLYAC